MVVEEARQGPGESGGLGLASDVAPAGGAGRVVEVAIDAAGGGGGRTYTYTVPPALADIVPGEAVLVEFGRRQALAVVLADALAPDGISLQSLAARVRTDG